MYNACHKTAQGYWQEANAQERDNVDGKKNSSYRPWVVP